MNGCLTPSSKIPVLRTETIKASYYKSRFVCLLSPPNIRANRAQTRKRKGEGKGFGHSFADLT